MNKESVTQILRDAIDVIQAKGWCQKTLVNQEGQVCTMGALDVAKRMALIDNPEESPDYWLDAYESAVALVHIELVGAMDVGPQHRIPHINDLPSTTQEDVMLGLKGALHKAENA